MATRRSRRPRPERPPPPGKKPGKTKRPNRRQTKGRGKPYTPAEHRLLEVYTVEEQIRRRVAA